MSLYALESRHICYELLRMYARTHIGLCCTCRVWELRGKVVRETCQTGSMEDLLGVYAQHAILTHKTIFQALLGYSVRVAIGFMEVKLLKRMPSRLWCVVSLRIFDHFSTLPIPREPARCSGRNWPEKHNFSLIIKRASDTTQLIYTDTQFEHFIGA